MNPTTEELIKWYEEMKLIKCSCFENEDICRRCYALDSHKERLKGRLDVYEEWHKDKYGLDGQDGCWLCHRAKLCNIGEEILMIKEVLE